MNQPPGWRGRRRHAGRPDGRREGRLFLGHSRRRQRVLGDGEAESERRGEHPHDASRHAAGEFLPDLATTTNMIATRHQNLVLECLKGNGRLSATAVVAAAARNPLVPITRIFPIFPHLYFMLMYTDALKGGPYVSSKKYSNVYFVYRYHWLLPSFFSLNPLGQILRLNRGPSSP